MAILFHTMHPLGTTPHIRVSESSVRHPREGGDPGPSITSLDFRLRGNDVKAKRAPYCVDLYSVMLLCTSSGGAKQHQVTSRLESRDSPDSLLPSNCQYTSAPHRVSMARGRLAFGKSSHGCVELFDKGARCAEPCSYFALGHRSVAGPMKLLGRLAPRGDGSCS
jgi:hypothetical protein